VRIWQDASSTDEVCEKTKMPYGVVLARVSNYRRRGIRLKKMPRKNSRKVDVEKLNKILCKAKSFSEKQGPGTTPAGDGGSGLCLPARVSSVRISLLDGTADGVRVVEKSNWIGQAMFCPRSRFKAVKSRPEFQKPGVYVLSNEPQFGHLTTIYVGEADPALPRLEQHLAKKPFWSLLTLFTSKGDTLHKASIQFLEARLVALARDAKRCILDNCNYPQPPSLSEADAVEAEGFLDEVVLLCSLLGLPVFGRRPAQGETVAQGG
jgi:hypothetical protein